MVYVERVVRLVRRLHKHAAVIRSTPRRTWSAAAAGVAAACDATAGDEWFKAIGVGAVLLTAIGLYV